MPGGNNDVHIYLDSCSAFGYTVAVDAITAVDKLVAYTVESAVLVTALLVLLAVDNRIYKVHYLIK